MTTFVELQNLFTDDSASVQFFKTVGKLLANINNKKANPVIKVDNMDVFFQAKRFRKLNQEADSSPQGRFSALMTEICDKLAVVEELNMFYLNKEDFFVKLHQAYVENFNVFQEAFGKSYKTLGPQLNKFLCPKDPDDMVYQVAELGNYIKYYSNSLTPEILESMENVILYTNTKTPNAELEMTALDMFAKGAKLFSVFSTTVSGTEDEPIEETTSMWVVQGLDLSDNPLFISISPDEFMANLSQQRFLVNQANVISLDLHLKRDFMNNRDDLFRKRAIALAQTTPFKCYHGEYTVLDEYNAMNEFKLGNAFLTFMSNFEPMSKSAIGSVQFNGEYGNLKIDTYWFVTPDMETVMNAPPMVPDTFYPEFNWKEITSDEFLTKAKQEGTLQSGLLH